MIAATTGNVKIAASIQAPSATQAEEMAITLAITIPTTTTILSDSKSAITNYARGNVCATAAHILSQIRERNLAIYLKWFPAHMGPHISGKGNTNHNETAHAAARDLTNRTAAEVDTDTSESYNASKEPMNTYSEIVTWYRLSRRTMPPPHPGLTRAEAVLYRQLQTHSVLTPALARYVCPEVYETDICRLCKDQRATLAHILWQCNNAATGTTLPQEIEDAKCSANLDTQLQAVNTIIAALELQRPSSQRQEEPTRSSAQGTTGSVRDLDRVAPGMSMDPSTED